MSEKNSISSRSLEGAETLHDRERYDDKDVFGHEEEHDVRNSTFLNCSASMLDILNTGYVFHYSNPPSFGLTPLLTKDSIQDSIMGARCRSHDSRDREQRNALLALVAGCRWSGARHSRHRLSGSVRIVHRMDLDSIQAEASGWCEALSSSGTFVLTDVEQCTTWVMQASSSSGPSAVNFSLLAPSSSLSSPLVANCLLAKSLWAL